MEFLEKQQPERKGSTTRYLLEPMHSELQKQSKGSYTALNPGLCAGLRSQASELPLDGMSDESPSEVPVDETPLNHPNVKVFCGSCKREITKTVRALLEGTDVCIGCLAQEEGLERKQYRILSPVKCPLLESTWTAFHQHLLLFSLERWGFGNWSQIREYMEYFGAQFTEDEIEAHYCSFYLADEACLPKFEENEQSPSRKDHGHIPVKGSSAQVSTATTHRTEVSSFPCDPFEHIDDFSNDEQLMGAQPRIEECSVKGYNQRRGEFDVDFDEGAEKVVASLEFREDDLPEEREVKVRILQQYNLRLQRRHSVEDFAIEHKLLDSEHQARALASQSQHQKEAQKTLRCFMKFSSFQSHGELVRRMAMASELRSIIEGMRSMRHSFKFSTLKEMHNQLRKSENYSEKPKKRGRPSKVLHLRKSSGFSEPSEKQEMLHKIGLNSERLQSILVGSQDMALGESRKLNGYHISIVEKC